MKTPETINTAEVPQAGRVYPKWMIYTGSMLGGPFVGGYLLAANFRIMGNRRGVMVTWLSTVALLSVLFAVIGHDILHEEAPILENIPQLTIPILYSLAYMLAAMLYQEKFIDNHIRKGGKKYPAGRFILISVIGLILFTILLLSVIFAVAPI